VGRAAVRVVGAGLNQAKSAVHGQPHFRGVLVFLPSSSHQQTGHNPSASGASSVLYPQQGQRNLACTNVSTQGLTAKGEREFTQMNNFQPLRAPNSFSGTAPGQIRRSRIRRRRQMHFMPVFASYSPSV